jgi:hypothetical protein
MHCWEGQDQALSAPTGAFRSVTAADGFVCAERASGAPACWRWEWDTEEWTALPVP